MDIQTLNVFISEAEIQELARKFQPKDAPIKDLAVRVTPEGVQVSGEAPTPMLTLPFESVWRPSVTQEGRVAVQLVDLKAAGFPATLFRSLVLGLLKDAVKEPFIEATEDAIVVDVQELVRRENLPVTLRFEMRAIRCIERGVVVEAGLPTATPPPG